MSDTPAFVLPEELTIYQVQALRDDLRQAWAQGTRQFDASGLNNLDTAGAQLLAALHKTAQEQQQPITWTGWSATAQETLQLLGLQHLLG